MWAIYKRELRSYFITPIGYIFAGMFIAVSGALFAYTSLLKQDSSGLYTYFVLLLLVFCILLPLLTMKLFAEERKSRTEQMLLTAPVTLTGIVCAKFFAAHTIFAVSLAVNSLNFILLYRYGSPNLSVILTNILGLFLVGAAFIALGLFPKTSSSPQFPPLRSSRYCCFSVCLRRKFPSNGFASSSAGSRWLTAIRPSQSAISTFRRSFTSYPLRACLSS